MRSTGRKISGNGVVRLGEVPDRLQIPAERPLITGRVWNMGRFRQVGRIGLFPYHRGLSESFKNKYRTFVLCAEGNQCRDMAQRDMPNSA